MASANTPGLTHCLLIGAAKPSEAQEGGLMELQDEFEDRQFEATQHDLIKMVNWCASFVYRRHGGGNRVYPIHVEFLVNDERLIPSDSNPLLTAKGGRMMRNVKVVSQNVFDDKDGVSDAVESSITDTTQKNVIIFFSGHGALTARRAGYTLFSPEEAAVGGLTHNVLVIPRSTDPPKESYTDEQLTSDVVKGLEGSPTGDDRNVYLVLHACNSGGMFRGWQVETALRQENGLSIALFASAASDSTSQWNSEDAGIGYVSIFAQCARPGDTLHTIQSNIFTRSLAEDPGDDQPGHSPCLVTIRPSMAAMEFLPQ